MVFAQPMAFYKMLAGDWNPDGTREHIESDASNTLSLLPGKTDGYFDIQLRQRRVSGSRRSGRRHASAE